MEQKNVMLLFRLFKRTSPLVLADPCHDVFALYLHSRFIHPIQCFKTKSTQYKITFLRCNGVSLPTKKRAHASQPEVGKPLPPQGGPVFHKHMVLICGDS